MNFFNNDLDTVYIIFSCINQIRIEFVSNLISIDTFILVTFSVMKIFYLKEEMEKRQKIIHYLDSNYRFKDRDILQVWASDIDNDRYVKQKKKNWCGRRRVLKK